VDFAGVVEAVGKNVREFKAGDRVFGEAFQSGAFAEFVSVSEEACGHMPEGIGSDIMAAVPVAGVTAWQAIVTHGKLQKGESVLINGSSGGVGHFAVQIAKALGAEVTAVCSNRNIDFVESLGADRVLAYDRENIHLHSGNYDLIIDTHGNLSFKDYKRLGKRGVMVGFTTIGQMVSVLLRKAFSKFPLVQFTAEANTKDLNTLASFIQAGKIRPHIFKTYPYQDIPKAIGYIESMRTKGKVVMLWVNEEQEDIRHPNEDELLSF
jgi:NADPH:quinone reductase-like Zn-dependent oxidoreductase